LFGECVRRETGLTGEGLDDGLCCLDLSSQLRAVYVFVWEVSKEPGLHLHWIEATTGDIHKVRRHQRPGLDIPVNRTHQAKEYYEWAGLLKKVCTMYECINGTLCALHKYINLMHTESC
jgi:hypothetical protein